VNLYADRDMARGRAAAMAVIARGGSAMDAALAQIEAAFAKPAIPNDLKARVAKAIQRGPDNPVIRARYGARARHLLDHRVFQIENAVRRVKVWNTDANLTQALAMRLRQTPGLTVMVLEELHLTLRWMRRYHPEKYFGVLEEVAA